MSTPPDPAKDEKPARDAPSALMFERLMEIARSSVLEEMASGIAHELNQPLGAIATFSQAGERMLNRPEPMVSGALDVLRHISSEAMGAGEGIRRIRRLFNREPAELVTCTMQELIDELRPILQVLADRVHGRLEIGFFSESRSVRVDCLRIQHVVLALVQNAFEAPQADGDAPVVTLSVRRDPYTVETSVVDSGSGIPPDQRERIFRPFFTTKPHGTGLGLASARAIVEAHEGTIGFEEAPGRGTRFWFRLPVDGAR